MSEPSSRSLEEALEALMRKAGMDDTPLYREIMAVVQPALDAARADERERCARIAYSEGKEFARANPAWLAACDHIADLIRFSEERTTSPKDGAAEG